MSNMEATNEARNQWVKFETLEDAEGTPSQVTIDMGYAGDNATDMCNLEGYAKDEWHYWALETLKCEHCGSYQWLVANAS